MQIKLPTPNGFWVNICIVGVVSVLLTGLLASNVFAESLSTSPIVNPRPVRISDLLEHEDWGRALIDPTGRWLVVEQIPPYDQLSDYGIDDLQTFGRIMVTDLAGSAPLTPLFGHDPHAEYRIESFSPDGRWLAFYSINQGRVSLGACDMLSRKIRTFRNAPTVPQYERTPPVWISATEIIYAALSDARQPVPISARRYTGTRLFEAWNKTWAGKKPAVTEAFSRGDGGGTFREGLLLKASIINGTTKTLARGFYTNLRPSADGRFVAGLQLSEFAQPLPERSYPVEMRSRHSRLTIFDLHSERGQVVSSDLDVAPGSLEWSPTGEALAYFAWSASGKSETGLFYTYNTRTKEVLAWPHSGLNLASHGLSYWRRPEGVAWLNGKLAVAAYQNIKDESPHFNDRAFASRTGLDSGKADWFLLNGSGRVQNLTAEFGAVSTVPISVTAKGLYLLADGNVWQIGTDGRKNNLTRANGGGLVPVSHDYWRKSNDPNVALVAQEQNKFILISMAHDETAATFTAPSNRASLMAGTVRSKAALFRENTDEGTKLLLKRENGPKIEIGRLNRYLSNIAMPEWKTISYSVNGGRRLQSGILLPYGYTRSRRYPVVVDIYPYSNTGEAPNFTIGETVSFYALELLAAKGYIVLYASNPRSVDRTSNGAIAGMAESVLQGVDALVAQGYADPDRINLIGFSQGGFASLWLATETERFRTIVSVNGWADTASHYFGQGVLQTFYPDEFPLGAEFGRYEDTESSSFVGIGGTPWQDVGPYFQRSPVYRANRIKSPVLLINSDMDGFALNQYEMMFTALYRLRKEASLVTYRGEGHGPSSPANIRDFWYRMFSGFDEWSDISRDQQGNLVWDGDKVKSRNGSPPLKPENFARFDQMILKNTKR